KTADELYNVVKPYGAKGLAWTKVSEDGFNGPIAKFFSSEEDYNYLTNALDAKVGDIIFFMADSTKVVADSLGALRLHLGSKHELYDPSELAFRSEERRVGKERKSRESHYEYEGTDCNERM